MSPYKRHGKTPHRYSAEFYAWRRSAMANHADVHRNDREWRLKFSPSSLRSRRSRDLNVIEDDDWNPRIITRHSRASRLRERI